MWQLKAAATAMLDQYLQSTLVTRVYLPWRAGGQGAKCNPKGHAHAHQHPWAESRNLNQKNIHQEKINLTIAY